jgi:hypothetical protein
VLNPSGTGYSGLVPNPSAPYPWDRVDWSRLNHAEGSVDLTLTTPDLRSVTLVGAFEYALDANGDGVADVDSDGDGLSDQREMEGWDVWVDYYGVGLGTDTFGNTAGLYHVTSNPNNPDSDGDGLDSKPDDASRILVHHHQNPMSFEGDRLSPKQVDTPETVFGVPQHGEPGRAMVGSGRLEILLQDSANHVFVEVDAEDEPWLYGIVERATRKLGAPMPKVGITDNLQPNAFTIGFAKIP